MKLIRIRTKVIYYRTKNVISFASYDGMKMDVIEDGSIKFS